MFIRPRRPRRTTRFRSRGMRTERERREHIIALATSATVKCALGIALIVAAVQSFRAVQSHAPGVPMSLRLFMPVIFAGGGLIAIRNGIKGFFQVREIRMLPLGDDEDDSL